MTRLPLKYYNSIFHWLLGIVSPSKESVFHAEEEHIDECIIGACDNILKVIEERSDEE